MAAIFTFTRSTYSPLLDETAAHTDYAIREQVTSLGTNGGNFFNWTYGVREPAVVGGRWPSNNDLFDPSEWVNAADNADPTSYYLYPLPTSYCSIEVWLRAKFTNVTGQISNIHLIMYTADFTGYGAGAEVKGRVAFSYPNGNPTLGLVNSDGDAGPLVTPTLNGTTMQLSTNPSQNFLDMTPAEEGLGSEGFSRYAVLQLITGSDAPAGEGGTSGFALYYDES